MRLDFSRLFPSIAEAETEQKQSVPQPEKAANGIAKPLNNYSGNNRSGGYGNKDRQQGYVPKSSNKTPEEQQALDSLFFFLKNVARQAGQEAAQPSKNAYGGTYQSNSDIYKARNERADKGLPPPDHQVKKTDDTSTNSVGKPQYEAPPTPDDE